MLWSALTFEPNPQKSAQVIAHGFLEDVCVSQHCNDPVGWVHWLAGISGTDGGA
jgi:hypothetical protein